ncbi:uncharacterized protein BJX67DRAFT_194767 [Aspergillus lucknowensis]|uniref:Uncharacterized protein n=1 Tax=Aspergillus lucknowensis TaxID=176173 RepID=A0ABR4LKI1_9EURO
MSPAPLPDSRSDEQLKTLARAFEALLLTAQQLNSREKLLQQRLEYAQHEYLKLASRFPGGPDSHSKVVSEKIVDRRLEFDSPRKQTLNALDVVKDLAESGNVGDSGLSAINDGVGLYKSLLDRNDGISSAGVVATRAGSLERDFTTKGTRGSLRCPFTESSNVTFENGVNLVETALPAQNGDTCGYQRLDPIKEEQLDGRSCSARSSSVRCPASRCPIRFLDQHSPEEIADYVERHKHEIPRSHAICVKQHSGSSRQMDAKYGDLTNMIRGLSEKHQVFLPDQGTRTASSSVGRVEKWAEEVKLKSELDTELDTPKEEAGANENDEDRTGHFDRPMREVRVGESPSRPWGIHVPITPPPAPESAASSPSARNSTADKPTNFPAIHGVETNARKAGRCPFGHGAAVPPPDRPATVTAAVRDEEPVGIAGDAADTGDEGGADAPPKDLPAHVVFNGPVFFGYSPKQTATFMQQLANLGVNQS